MTQFKTIVEVLGLRVQRTWIRGQWHYDYGDIAAGVYLSMYPASRKRRWLP